MEGFECKDMEEEQECGGGGGGVSVSGGSLRTRSQVAPDWTVQESMILVNEIRAVEGDCLNTLASFQKWKIIVQNCNALEVHRSLNQCRRKWDSLLADYKRINQLVALPHNFDTDLFKAIDDHVKAREGPCDTDPDTDPEADPPSLNVIAQSVSKKKRRRLMPQQRSIEDRVNSQRRGKNERTTAEQCSSEGKGEQATLSIDEKMIHEESSQEEKEQKMVAKLRKNVELISGLLKGNLADEVDCRLADLKNVETIQTDFTRRRGDELIVFLGNLAGTLDQLCHLVQECG